MPGWFEKADYTCNLTNILEWIVLNTSRWPNLNCLNLDVTISYSKTFSHSRLVKYKSIITKLQVGKALSNRAENFEVYLCTLLSLAYLFDCKF